MIRKISFAFIVIGFLLAGNACSTFVPVPIELTEQAQETAQVETEVAGKVFQVMTINALETLIVKLSETPVPPTATVTPSPTPLPTSTNTPEPTATDTPIPTATDTPEPTATDTPIPTATDTPEPTATDTPIPTATDTPVPTATDTPIPTATDTPEPTATDTPEPTATDTPEPTATDRPVPTATDLPMPTATDKTEPTATDRPEPTVVDLPEIQPIPTSEADPGVFLMDFTTKKILITSAESGGRYQVAVDPDELILIQAHDDPRLEFSAADGDGSEPAAIFLSDSIAVVQPDTGGLIELNVVSEGGLSIERIEKFRLDENDPVIRIPGYSGESCFVVQIPAGDGVRFEVLFDEEAGGAVSFLPWSGERPTRYSGMRRVEWTSCCGLSEIYFVLLDPGAGPMRLTADWISRDGGN